MLFFSLETGIAVRVLCIFPAITDVYVSNYGKTNFKSTYEILKHRKKGVFFLSLRFNNFP